MVFFFFFNQVHFLPTHRLQGILITLFLLIYLSQKKKKKKLSSGQMHKCNSYNIHLYLPVSQGSQLESQFQLNMTVSFRQLIPIPEREPKSKRKQSGFQAPVAQQTKLKGTFGKCQQIFQEMGLTFEDGDLQRTIRIFSFEKEIINYPPLIFYTSNKNEL